MGIAFNGSKIDLEKRLDELKNQKVLVRAINNNEFGQLLKEGPSRFKFNQWTNYEVKIGPYTEEFCRENGTGTVILFLEPELEFIRKHFRGNENLADPIYACLVDFYGEVEVYDLSH